MKKGSHFPKYAIGFVLGVVLPPVLKSGVGKKALTYLTAGGIIVKNGVMEGVENIHASSLDIAEDAKDITERYYQNQEKAAEEEAEAEDEEQENEEA